jgi:eukaryotic-like serine/threonine-protein kinase
MATMFGRFEIQSELSRSATALIYKAMDLKANDVVALKVQSLEPLGSRMDAFVETLIAEGESARDLACQNIVVLHGAGEIEGKFCAAMEYVQGNSIATMVARNEGFSIWDLVDITRQICAGLEQAAARNVMHCSLEPAKIMVQWDGMVKILGYGISNMSLIGAECGKGLGPLMSYCSPEQIRGETIDLRSNLFTLGAILYEMVAGRKAFDDPDPVGLVSQIENAMPAAPLSVNPKIHPLMSDLIMKALAKDPGERYQRARDLLEDLENCKESGSGKKAAPETTKSTSVASVGASVAANSAARAAASRKFVSAELSAAAAAPSGAPVTPKPASPKPVSPSSPQINAPAFAPMARPAPTTPAASDSNSGARLISDFDMSAVESQAARGPVLSAGAAEFVESAPSSAATGRGTVTTPKNDGHSSRVAIDPLMSEPAANSSGKSFFDLAEMPPLKEPVFVRPISPEPSSAPAQDDLPKLSPRNSTKEQKPKAAAREMAGKAIHQIATIPPRLMLYSILGAVGLILVVVIAIFFHVRSEDDEATAAPQKMAAAESTAPSTSSQPVVQTSPQIAQPAPPPVEAQPKLSVRAVAKRAAKTKPAPPAPAPVPVVAGGDALIDSSPQGASFQIDAKSDPSWVTPFTVTGLSPGKHIISVNKSGYSSDIHSIEVASGGKLSLAIHLSPINALVVVSSTPPGAEITIDGKPTGRVTPAQFAVEKGSHTVLLRKHGYLDETTTADLGPAQNFQFAPTLRALGNTEDMRPLGGLNRLFGRGGEGAAGMGSIVIRTQPKGAQVAINQQVLEKTSPLGVAVGPGNYIVDITLTGFKPIHKVISVERGNRTAIDEILERQ